MCVFHYCVLTCCYLCFNAKSFKYQLKSSSVSNFFFIFPYLLNVLRAESSELCSLTSLASTPHQLALKCMPYNGLLVVVVWVLLEESTCVLLTTLV